MPGPTGPAGRALTAAGVAGVRAVSRALSNEERIQEEEELVTDVVSSVIRQIRYKNEVITVVFNRGGEYDYPGTRELYEDFIAAPSIGQYFNAHIR